MGVIFYRSITGESIIVEEIRIEDETTAGKYLVIESDSDTTVLTADRTLTFDVNNADRNVDLGGDLILTGSNIVGSWRVNGTLTLESAATITNTSAGDVELTADNTSTSGRNAWQVDARVSGACTGSSRAGYFHVTNTNAVGITGELTGLEAKVRSTSSDTASAKGIHVSLDAKTKTITLGRGLEISLDAAAGGGITTAEGLRIAHNSSGSHTTIDGIVIEGPGTWTYGIDMSGGTFGTAEIRLGNSATIKNTTSGTLDICPLSEDDVKFFSAATSGENKYVYIYGDDSGSPKYGRVGTNSSGDFEVTAEDNLNLISGVEVNIMPNGTAKADFAVAEGFRLFDDYLCAWGLQRDGAIEYDEDGDDTWAFSLPTGGMSFRTAATDADNAGLIKVSKIVITAGDLTASAATDNENLLNQPAGSVLLSAKFVLDTQFSGGSVSDVDCTVGLGGDENGLIAAAAHNLYSDTVGTEYTTRGAYWSATTAAGYHSASATQWIAYFTAVGDTWDNITGGQITAYFMYIDFQGT